MWYELVSCQLALFTFFICPECVTKFSGYFTDVNTNHFKISLYMLFTQLIK